MAVALAAATAAEAFCCSSVRARIRSKREPETLPDNMGSVGLGWAKAVGFMESRAAKFSSSLGSEERKAWLSIVAVGCWFGDLGVALIHSVEVNYL